MLLIFWFQELHHANVNLSNKMEVSDCPSLSTTEFVKGISLFEELEEFGFVPDDSGFSDSESVANTQSETAETLPSICDCSQIPKEVVAESTHESRIGYWIFAL